MPTTQPHPEAEAASAPVGLLEPDASFHGAHQLTHDAEPEACASILAGGAGVDLGEGLEDAVAHLCRHPDAGVAHLAQQGQGVLAACLGTHRYLDAAVGGELDRVAKQVEEDLPQAAGITNQPVGHGGVDRQPRREALVGGTQCKGPERIPHQATQAEILHLQFQVARIGFCEVEQLVDHLQQGAPGIERRFEHAPLLRLDVRVEHQFGHAEHRIERRANLMAEIGEKIALCPGGRFGRLSRRLQRILDLLAQGDVDQHPEGLHGPAVAPHDGLAARSQPAQLAAHVDDAQIERIGLAAQHRRFARGIVALEVVGMNEGSHVLDVVGPDQCGRRSGPSQGARRRAPFPREDAPRLHGEADLRLALAQRRFQLFALGDVGNQGDATDDPLTIAIGHQVEIQDPLGRAFASRGDGNLGGGRPSAEHLIEMRCQLSHRSRTQDTLEQCPDQRRRGHATEEAIELAVRELDSPGLVETHDQGRYVFGQQPQLCLTFAQQGFAFDLLGDVGTGTHHAQRLAIRIARHDLAVAMNPDAAAFCALHRHGGAQVWLVSLQHRNQAGSKRQAIFAPEIDCRQLAQRCVLKRCVGSRECPPPCRQLEPILGDAPVPHRKLRALQ